MKMYKQIYKYVSNNNIKSINLAFVRNIYLVDVEQV